MIAKEVMKSHGEVLLIAMTDCGLAHSEQDRRMRVLADRVAIADHFNPPWKKAL
jgi:hypothetical protein